jgi:large subunit ribosomal protein L21
MYAVIRAGGKQHKVAKGDVIEVELIKGDSDSVEFTPLLIMDDKGKLRSSTGDLNQARVHATVLDEIKGEKLEIYKFKNKRRYRRHTGHRQRYSRIEISDIKLTGGRGKEPAKEGAASDGS